MSEKSSVFNGMDCSTHIRSNGSNGVVQALLTGKYYLKSVDLDLDLKRVLISIDYFCSRSTLCSVTVSVSPVKFQKLFLFCSSHHSDISDF